MNAAIDQEELAQIELVYFDGGLFSLRNNPMRQMSDWLLSNNYRCRSSLGYSVLWRGIRSAMLMIDNRSHQNIIS